MINNEIVNNKPSGSRPIFIVVKNGIVEKVYLDQDVEIIVIDQDVGDAPKMADVTGADIGTIDDLRAHELYEPICHLLPSL